MKITVAGSGAWGTALAVSLCSHQTTTLLCHSPEKAARMAQSRENPRLRGIQLPQTLQITADPGCICGQDLVVLASPSFAIRELCAQLLPYLSPETILVCVTKGIEQGTHLRMSQIVEELTGHGVVCLTGPSHAEEVAKAIPTACVAACPDQAMAEAVQDAFMTESLRIYTSPDIVGAELGGALKNVIALCAGVVDGMGYGDNTKAMLMTRGLTEIARLGVAMGAQKETLAGLSGIGDLIVTCTSRHSRNRQAGVLIGQGKSVSQAMEEVGAVVEGYYAARSARELAQAMGVEMPIVEASYQVLYQGKSAEEVIHQLLLRRRKAESEDAGWL